MRIDKFPYSEVPQLSKRDLSYIEEQGALTPFFKYPVTLESFQQVINDRKHLPVDRKTLTKVLREQYSKIETSESVLANIRSLERDNTFTLVTAHQPSLFTGPLYYVYKIISLLNLCKTLNEKVPAYHFVPVFISSGEDHDFEEVNHLNLFNKTLSWESGESGSVGKMKTATLKPVLEQLKALLGNSENALEIYSLIEKAHTEPEYYAESSFRMANELFKDYGLVILNTSHPELKRLLIPIIRKDIFEKQSHDIVNSAIVELEKVGYASQATPREINFFYLDKQIRERIVEENGYFHVINTDIQFSRQEMESEIEAHPEKFSPNVIMRPIYQETILPNLAYIGGGGEIAYWLERKKQFEHFGLNFPMLIRRNSALWVDSTSIKRMQKLGLNLADFFQEAEELIKLYVDKNAEGEIKLDSEKELLLKVFESVAEKTETVDPTLVKTSWAEHARAVKSLENLETRLVRAEKQKHDNAIQQIRTLKEKLFPGNGLQERYDNFLPFYLKHGRSFFEVLLTNLDPLEKQFTVIWDE